LAQTALIEMTPALMFAMLAVAQVGDAPILTYPGLPLFVACGADHAAGMVTFTKDPVGMSPLFAVNVKAKLLPVVLASTLVGTTTMVPAPFGASAVITGLEAMLVSVPPLPDCVCVVKVYGPCVLGAVTAGALPS
jgi:hypothetical protein